MDGVKRRRAPGRRLPGDAWNRRAEARRAVKERVSEKTVRREEASSARGAGGYRFSSGSGCPALAYAADNACG